VTLSSRSAGRCVAFRHTPSCNTPTLEYSIRTRLGGNDACPFGSGKPVPYLTYAPPASRVYIRHGLLMGRSYGPRPGARASIFNFHEVEASTEKLRLEALAPGFTGSGRPQNNQVALEALSRITIRRQVGELLGRGRHSAISRPQPAGVTGGLSQ